MGFFGRLRDSLSKTKQQIVDRFDDIVRQADVPERRSRPVDVDTIDALEELLISADIGVAATDRIIAAVRQRSTSGAGLRDLVKRELLDVFASVEGATPPCAPPRITLIVGVNGTGKTTTVGKLANLLKLEGRQPLICAADTFRAAAVEQLEIWAGRAGVDMVRARDGADPAAVVFDAISSARARGRDPVLVDTAGRLHTRVNLMNELDKIKRVAAREVPGAPHDVLLVLDSTVGQNGLAQAREFMAVAGVNGIVLTKLDGTAKGGVAVAIANDLKLPIRYVGVGEGIDDLVPFDAGEYVNGLFEEQMVTGTDEGFMARALFHAARGRGRASPNPVVGAVVVSADGVVVGQGYHARAGGAHAEVSALEMAAGRARGGTLFCTLEPCIHTGRTGPCVPGIAEAGIARVVAAVEDPNPLVNGSGFRELHSRGIRVEVGIGGEAARNLNQPFFTTIQARRPFVILKAAISADGYMSAEPGRRTALTSAAANRHAHLVRAEVDAVGVGVETVVVDDPLLTARDVFRERPLIRVIFNRTLRTPPQARVLSTPDAGPVMIVTTAEAAGREELRQPLEARGATIVSGDGTVAGSVSALVGFGVTSMLIEGGARLHLAAWDEGVIDFVRVYVTPHVIGAGGVPFLGGRRFLSTLLARRRVEPLGPDVLIEGYVHGPR